MLERLLDILRKDLARKVTAILFAVVIWYAVRQQIQEKDYYSNVEVVLNAENNSVYLPEKKVILTEVMIKGSKRDLDLLTDKSQIMIQVDIPEPKEGQKEYTFKIRDSHFKLPGSTLNVADLDPKEFTVPVDLIISKEVPIRTKYNASQLENSQSIYQTFTDPTFVTISGPSKVLKNITEVYTKELIIKESVEEVETELDLNNNISMEGENKVTVRLTYNKTVESKSFDNVPIHILNLNNSEYFVESMSVDSLTTLTVAGPKELLDELSQGSVRAFIEMNSELGEGIYKRPVKVYIDSKKCYLQYTEPAEVQITIKQRK